MRMRHSRGFTMIELITIMILLGILAVVAVPRLDSAAGYRSVEFRDRVIAALRYAHKTASSHRRLVCATLTANTLTLTIDHDKSGACDGAPNNILNLPGANSNLLTSSGESFSGVPSGTLYFQPDGRITDALGTSVIAINGSVDGLALVVYGSTGYVGDGS